MGQNYQLSDPIDPLLKLQGISWLMRKAISLATVTLHVHQYSAPAPTPTPKKNPPRSTPSHTHHIDITQVASGGISTTSQEKRVLDWRERDHEDRLFGRVRGRSRFFEGLAGFEMVGHQAEDGADRRFLLGLAHRDGRTASAGAGADAGGDAAAGKSAWCDERNGRHVQSWVVNVDDGPTGGWTAEQVWGFEIVAAHRRHTRRIVVRKGEHLVARARLVYDYRGDLDR